MAGVQRQNSREPKFQYGMKILLVLPVLVALLGAVGVWFGWGVVLLLMAILVGVAMADGSVRFLPDRVSAKSLDAALTAAGGDAAGEDW